ncbi:hypothetical protein C4585_00765 [Candidatus Parcubacteria bacterium]|nr:MAG: hypothetical protein C4585_00765 [Candidatus Parcubacteria bacterium]
MEKIFSDNRLLIGGAAALVIIGALWFMTRDAEAPTAETGNQNTVANETTNENNESTLPTTPSRTSDDESITVEDQAATSSVKISSVTFAETGWVAVRDDRGWTLGAKRFEPGTHTDVIMTLLRATEAGQRYQALLYIDDGDGKFDLEKEILLTRSGGSVAGVMFSAN